MVSGPSRHEFQVSSFFLSTQQIAAQRTLEFDHFAMEAILPSPNKYRVIMSVHSQQVSSLLKQISAWSETPEFLDHSMRPNTNFDIDMHHCLNEGLAFQAIRPTKKAAKSKGCVISRGMNFEMRGQNRRFQTENWTNASSVIVHRYSPENIWDYIEVYGCAIAFRVEFEVDDPDLFPELKDAVHRSLLHNEFLVPEIFRFIMMKVVDSRPDIWQLLSTKSKDLPKETQLDLELDLRRANFQQMSRLLQRLTIYDSPLKRFRGSGKKR